MRRTKYVLLTFVLGENNRREPGERTHFAASICEERIMSWQMIESTYSSGRL